MPIYCTGGGCLSQYAVLARAFRGKSHSRGIYHFINERTRNFACGWHWEGAKTFTTEDTEGAQRKQMMNAE
jgi:hypothetical protein